MKRLMLIILIITFSIAGRSAELLDGYIVLVNNDTIRCKIKSVDFHGVTVINEKGEKEVYRIKDEKIVAYGYVEKGRQRDYYFHKIGVNYFNGFYQRLINRPRYKLYGRAPEVSGGNPTYILFKQSGESLNFDACVAFCPWKKKLREFLKDEPKADEAIDKANPYTLPLYLAGLNREVNNKVED